MKIGTLGTVDDVLAIFPEGSITKQALYQHARDGRIPAIRVGRKLFFDVAKVRAHLENGGAALGKGQ